MANENRVLIYSNGIADFQRVYEVAADAPKHISLPVRQDHLADLLASFNVFGDVRLDAPPTFRPANELEGNISIDAEDVLDDLIGKLSGARIRVVRAGSSVEGTLVGLHQEQEASGGEPSWVKSLVILASDGLHRCPLRDIETYQFLDDDVRSEIEKALQRNYQRIKPNSTFVELVLSTREARTPAVIQYTVPAAAWKISYRLRLVAGQAAELQGFAIVDNNTDEDWTDFRIAVVTGEPLTFTTDLAESKTPRRKHVNLVSEMARGGIEVEESIAMARSSPLAYAAAEPESGDEFAAVYDVSHPPMASRVAEARSAEIREVGDFCIYESAGLVSIPAKRSAAIPVFNAKVGELPAVLHYRWDHDPKRPYRSIEFTNRAGFSLGRGVCTVFEEGSYAGSCIFPALKPDESRLLAFALETGVAIFRDEHPNRETIIGLRASAGSAYRTVRYSRGTDYSIRNQRDREYQLFVDHPVHLKDPEVTAEIVSEEPARRLEPAAQIAQGLRFSITLPPKSELKLSIREQTIRRATFELIAATKQGPSARMDWFRGNFVDTNGPLATHKGVQRCLRLEQKRELKQEEIEKANREIERLTQRQTRLRENIKAGGKHELANRWRAELDEAEREIRRIEDERLPELRNAEQLLLDELRTALGELTAEWMEGE